MREGGKGCMEFVELERLMSHNGDYSLVVPRLTSREAGNESMVTRAYIPNCSLVLNLLKHGSLRV